MPKLILVFAFVLSLHLTSASTHEKSKEKCLEYAKPASNEEKCGISSDKSIVGPQLAESKQFPHLALIGYEGEDNEKQWLCGGSLISEDFILTSANCVLNAQYGVAKYIWLGDLLSDINSQEFNVGEMIVHPDHESSSLYHDIALIRIDGKAIFDPYVRPACLETGVDLSHKPIAIGWGKADPSHDSEALQEQLLYFTNEECNDLYRNNLGRKLRDGIVEKTQICAGSRVGSKAQCQASSGGPLQTVNENAFCTYRIVGVNSFSEVCTVGNVPQLYTRVSNYVEWIESKVWP